MDRGPWRATVSDTSEQLTLTFLSGEPVWSGEGQRELEGLRTRRGQCGGRSWGQTHRADTPVHSFAWQLHLLALDLKGAIWPLTKETEEDASLRVYVFCKIRGQVLQSEQKAQGWGGNLKKSCIDLQQPLISC